MFIASLSDVEHEVKPITSGFWVTLTYNLYSKKDIKAKSAVISKQVENDLGLKEVLGRLLKDPASFPEGGFIGFRLNHKYPFQDSDSTTALSDMKEYLKGSDAAIKRACDLLSLAVSIKAVYDDGEGLAVLLDNIIDTGYHTYDSLFEDLERSYGGQAVVGYQEGGNWDLDCEPIVWVRPLASVLNGFTSTHLDGEICMIATAPYAEDRFN